MRRYIGLVFIFWIGLSSSSGLEGSPIEFPHQVQSFVYNLFDLKKSAARNVRDPASGTSVSGHRIILSQVAGEDLPPDWMNARVIVFGLLFIVLVSLGSYGLGMNLRDNRKKELEKQVLQRTEELHRANFELTLRNSELDRFVYSTSHDLSSPLKSILGLINVIRMEKPTSRQIQYLDMMEKSVERLEHYIEEIIQYSRNARMPVTIEPVDFKSLVWDMIKTFEDVPGYKRIQFRVEDNLDKPMLTDVTRLKIIMTNLLSNAIKFHRTEEGIVPVVRISATRRDTNYVLEVEDNGRGIQSEYVSRIFEMFFRASEEGLGSGLGLYILKETVNRLQGNVEVRSRINEGTTFIVTLPGGQEMNS